MGAPGPWGRAAQSCETTPLPGVATPPWSPTPFPFRKGQPQLGGWPRINVGDQALEQALGWVLLAFSTLPLHSTHFPMFRVLGPGRSLKHPGGDGSPSGIYLLPNMKVPRGAVQIRALQPETRGPSRCRARSPCAGTSHGDFLMAEHSEVQGDPC